MVHIVNYLKISGPEEQKNVVETLAKLLTEFFEDSEKKGSVLNAGTIITAWEEKVFKNVAIQITPFSVPYLIAYDHPLLLKRWRKIYFSLSPEPAQFWKLDCTENSSRMRRKLKKKHCILIPREDKLKEIQPQENNSNSIKILANSKPIQKNVREELIIADGISQSFLNFKVFFFLKNLFIFY